MIFNPKNPFMDFVEKMAVPNSISYHPKEWQRLREKYI